MLRFRLVRDTALLPLRYLLIVLLFVLLIGGMQVIHAVGRFELSGSAVLRWIVADALFVAVPISCLLGAVITLFTILLRPSHRLIKLIGLFLSCGALLVVGTVATFSYAFQTTPQNHPLPPFQESRLYRTAEESFYGATRQGTRIRQVVTFSRSREPAFAVHDGAVLDPFARSIRVPAADMTLRFQDMRLTTPGIIRAPSGIEGLMQDTRRLAVTLAVAAAPALGTEELAGLPSSDAVRPATATQKDTALRPLLALCAALAFVVTAAWSVVRMTRWPIFNALVIAGMLRLLLLLVRAAGDPGIVASAARFTSFVPSGYLLAAALAVSGVLLLLLRSVLPSFSAWQREIRHG